MGPEPVGVVYDPRFLEHETGYHPEQPERLLWAAQAMAELGLWPLCTVLSPRLATVEELGLFHTTEYIRKVEEFSLCGGGMFSPDTTGSAGTYRAAALAVGAVIRAIETTVTRSLPAALCLVRPPGHHAHPSLGKGFCFFNNVVVGALWARERFSLERILIVDWDVHHGDGTQAAFWQDERVLYFSLHQWPFYPYTGAVDEIGSGPGAGFTVNVPFPHGAGDAEYVEAVDRLLIPMARAFSPELILVSAGYDAHFADQLGDMDVTGQGYWELASRLKALARRGDIPLVLVLEGGYSTQGMGWGVAATVAALADVPLSKEEPCRPPSKGVRDDVRRLFASISARLSQYWGKLFT